MLNRKAAHIVLAASLLVLPLCAQAQQAQFPVIVVFQDHVRFQDFAHLYTPDAREAAQPQAWRYLDRAVVGAVRYQEQKHGFRADHVYSHALRGFAAHLTAQQIQDLEHVSLVRYVQSDGPVHATAGAAHPTGTAPATPQVIPWGISRVGTDV